MRSLCLAVLAVSLAVAADEAPPPQKNRMSTPMPMVIGDFAALTLSSQLTSLKLFDSPFLVQYDRKTERVMVLLKGQQGTVENARTSMAPLVDFVKGTLRDNEATVIYLNGTKEIVRREDGKFITP
jgi:hypothetical protein